MTEARALLWLISSLIQRLLREGVVLRSLLSPPVLLAGLVLITLGIIAADQRLNRFAVDADSAELTTLVAALEEVGVNPWVVADVEAQVRAGAVSAGTDGDTLWFRRRLPVHTSVEAVLRERKNASWRPIPRYASATSPGVKTAGHTLVVLMTTLYGVYAVVFGAAAVLRDRDEGTLEVELSLPVRTWVHGAARFIAAWLVVGGFYAYGLLVLAAVRSLPELGSLLLHGIGAVGIAAALGLIAATSRAERGFSSVLAIGISGLTAMVVLGFSWHELRPFMPIVSVFSEASGLFPIGTALGLGGAGILFFAYRMQV